MNITDIAHLAGVSRATVSRYLNNGYVSQHNREAIARVIEETGYIPSAQAQTLRTGKTGFVGAILPKISSESVSRMVSGISDVLAAEGYQLLLANTDNDPSRELEYLRTLTDTRVDGLILIATILTEEHTKLISELSVPLVVLGQELPDVTCVFSDSYDAMRELMQHILKTSSRPAFIGVDEQDLSAGLARRQAFEDACSAAGLGKEDYCIVQGDFSVVAGSNCTEEILRSFNTCDAIVCATDAIAAGALAHLHERGLAVPEDIQLAGVGDSVLSQVMNPRLTTIHHFYKTSGAEAAKLLVSAMADEAPVARQIKMSHEIVVRDSTRVS